MELLKDKHCANCGNQLYGFICHECGQKQVSERWSTPILVQQFIHQITNIERGFVFTIKELFKSPGRLIHNYWKGITVIYYNPFRYLLIWTAINLLITFWLGIDDMLQASMEPDFIEEQLGAEKMESADQQFDSWMNILVLLLIPIISVVTKWMFKNAKKNYAEHLILNSYIFGHQALITSITQFIFYFLPGLFSIYIVFNFAIGWIYNSYIFYNTFNEKIGTVVLKALVIGILGMLAFFVLVVIFSGMALLLS
ncbi:MAG: DUF3667 domain-containing protein [Bacteroidia bacterium]|nr:DUF3667 domain-containing protein [Bacteroidia bacterium]